MHPIYPLSGAFPRRQRNAVSAMLLSACGATTSCPYSGDVRGNALPLLRRARTARVRRVFGRRQGSRMSFPHGTSLRYCVTLAGTGRHTVRVAATCTAHDRLHTAMRLRAPGSLPCRRQLHLPPMRWHAARGCCKRLGRPAAFRGIAAGGRFGGPLQLSSAAALALLATFTASRADALLWLTAAAREEGTVAAHATCAFRQAGHRAVCAAAHKNLGGLRRQLWRTAALPAAHYRAALAAFHTGTYSVFQPQAWRSWLMPAGQTGGTGGCSLR